MPRRILTRILDAWVDPESAFVRLYAEAENAFWLDSGSGTDGRVPKGTSYLGAAARVLLAESTDELFPLLRAELETGTSDERPARSAGHGFRLGWVGWLGYELGARALELPAAASPYPGAAFQFVDRALAFDHEARTVTLLVLDEADGAQQWLDETEERLRSLDSAPDAGSDAVPDAVPAASAHPANTATWRHGPEHYAELVERCQESIRRGDAYQLCLTNEIRVAGRFDPLASYLALRRRSPSHHGGYLRFGDLALLSASPEQFLRIGTDRVAVTKPIKGTRPRGSTLARDLELRAELESSDKERAENLMIVDLMRNDLARVAQLGTVEVTSLLAVESYSSVHQLVSSVQATLRDGLDVVAAIAALFPAGSMTGAPKLSAMRILSELEGGARGVYSGVFGYLSLDGAVDLAMVIRSILLRPDGATIGTGGGITALSVAADEVEETRIKAAPLLAVLGAAGV